MKLFNIPPIHNLELMEINDNYFCLAHLAERDHSYLSYFINKAKEGKFVLLDNGAAEGKTVTTESLVYLVSQIHPTEVVAPDVIGKTALSIHKYEQFKIALKQLWSKYPELQDVRVMAVPQGLDPLSWMYSYTYYSMDSFVNTIGFSKFALPLAYGQILKTQSIMATRLYALGRLNSDRMIKKDIHFLGLREPIELKIKHTLDAVRSNDSALPIVAASMNMEIEGTEWLTVSTDPLYFFKPLDKKQIKLAEKNIEWLNKIE